MSNTAGNNALELAIGLERRRKDLLMARDFEGLKTLISPKIIYVHSTGGVDTFESYFEKLANQTLVYLDVDYVELSGSLFGDDTLIVTGKMNAELVLGTEKKTVHSIYMGVWIRQPNSSWHLCAHQGANRIV